MKMSTLSLSINNLLFKQVFLLFLSGKLIEFELLSKHNLNVNV